MFWDSERSIASLDLVEQGFLKRERKRIAEYFQPEFLEYLQSKERSLRERVQEAPNAQLGADFPVDASALRVRVEMEGICQLLGGDAQGWQKLGDAQPFIYSEAVV